MVLLVYNTLGKLKDQGMRVTDLATQLTTIEQAVLGAVPQHFGPFGIDVQQIQGLSINLPPDVQAAVDTRSKMGVLGVNYMQYQAGQALTTAAANPSGGAGAMAGAGVGLGPVSAWDTAWSGACNRRTSKDRCRSAPSAVPRYRRGPSSARIAVLRWRLRRLRPHRRRPARSAVSRWLPE